MSHLNGSLAYPWTARQTLPSLSPCQISQKAEEGGGGGWGGEGRFHKQMRLQKIKRSQTVKTRIYCNNLGRPSDLPWADAQAVVVNFPHNPTGALLTQSEQHRLISLCREHQAWLFSDEMYRLLEHDPAVRSCHDLLMSGCRYLCLHLLISCVVC